MKIRVKIVCVALMIGVSFALPAPAAADKVQVTFGPYQANPGGEFTLTVMDPDGWLDLSSYSFADGTRSITSFQTFCIEKTEFIGGGGIYDAETDPNAMNGGGGGGATGDPVSKGTGWLYSQFAGGSLAGYDYDDNGVGRKVSAGLLQIAIWMLEDEQPFDSTGNDFLIAVLAKFGSQTDAQADGGNGYGVLALNLSYDGIQAQDQLYYDVSRDLQKVPDGGMTLMLLGMTVGGLGTLRRRFRKF